MVQADRFDAAFQQLPMYSKVDSFVYDDNKVTMLEIHVTFLDLDQNLDRAISAHMSTSTLIILKNKKLFQE